MLLGREKYAKGKCALDLFPNKKRSFGNDTAPVETFAKIAKFNCPLGEIIREEIKSESIRIAEHLFDMIVSAAVAFSELTKLKQCLNEIVTLQQVSVIYSGDLSDINSLDSNLVDFYNNEVAVDEDMIIKIAIETKTQYECELWKKCRFIRISSSNRAHRAISTRNPENLAKSFANLRNKSEVSHVNLDYGKRNEKFARQIYSEIMDRHVLETGVIIHSKQPWLCASPDGLVLCADKSKVDKLLEIKCPITCKKKPIVDTDGTINVTYLRYDNSGNIVLKRSHIYYSQVQIQLYCTNLNSVDFFVYSPAGSLCLTVEKDEEFLQKNITLLERFYFAYLLRNIVCN